MGLFMKTLNIDYSELTGKVYATFESMKKDVTNQFLYILLRKFPVNSTQVVTVGGKDHCRVIVVDMDKEVVIDGNKIGGSRDSF
jgi:hypothetical protein